MQKWTCPIADQWDRYLLDPRISERQELEQHLEGCSVCRFFVDQRRHDLEELDSVWLQSGIPRIIHLSSLAMMENTDEPSSTLLAAEGNGEDAKAEAITLSSPDQTVLLRAVRDTHTNETWLYVMAKEPSMYQNVVVRPFGEDQEYLTDSEGRVKLGMIEWPTPEKLTAEVRLPKATFTMVPIEEPIDEDKSIVLQSSTGDRIRVTFTGEGRNRLLEIEVLDIPNLQTEVPLKVAVRGPGMKGMPQVKLVTLNRVTFDGMESTRKLEIYLYQ